MRVISLALVLIMAMVPTVEALAGATLHSGCGSASSHATQDTGGDMHAGHPAAADAPAPLPDAGNECDCGCDCGPVHGCTAGSTAAPETAGTMLLFPAAVAPAEPFQLLSSRIDTPLYRPPIPQLTI